MWLRELINRIPEPAPVRRRASRRANRTSSWRLAEPMSLFESIPERFVQDIWHGLLFDAARITTIDGDAIRVLDPGIPNDDRGPDFRDARLRINEVDWRGDVEIHVRSSDWIAHNHTSDPAYDSVILHVVLSADIWTGRLARPDGTPLPELVLLPFLGQSLHTLLRELRLKTYEAPLACSRRLEHVPSDLISAWIRKLGRERLNDRKCVLAQNVDAAGGLESLLFHAIFEAMGYAKNGQPMLDLARRVPIQALRRYDQVQREALLFGAAGLLHFEDARRRSSSDSRYVDDLRDRFESLPENSSIVRMRGVCWSFFRLRPANFPTLRIAQAAALADRGAALGADSMGRLSDAISSSDGLAALRRLFAATPGPYWNSHVRLDRSCAPRSPAIGRGRIDRILVNAVLPVLMLYAEQVGNRTLTSHVVHAFERLPPERDEVVSMFADHAVAAKSVVDSQGMHQLFKTRCRRGGCLSCVVGRHLMSSSSSDPLGYPDQTR